MVLKTFVATDDRTGNLFFSLYYRHHFVIQTSADEAIDVRLTTSDKPSGLHSETKSQNTCVACGTLLILNY